MTKFGLGVLLFFSVILAQTDTTKPIITLGTSTSTITEAMTLNLSANVLDSGGVNRVEFYQDGIKIQEKSEAPYNFGLPINQENNGTLEFYAIAYDNAGNSNSSSAITVTVNIAVLALKGSDDFFTTFVNTPLDVGVDAGLPALKMQGNVLQNDGLEGARISGSSDVVGGSLKVRPMGGFVFIPDDGFIGQAGFTYTAASAAGQVSASVTITVQEANPDVAGDQMIWFVAAGASGKGSAVKPFATLAEAEVVSKDGDIIYVFSGNYTCGDTCFTFKPFQMVIGQGSTLVLGDATFGETAEAPLLNSLSTGFVLANQSSVRGFHLKFTGQEGSTGVQGADVLTGSIAIEDMMIDNPGGFGILINESNAKDASTGAKHTLTIKNVTVNNPGKMGILSNDALAVTIENCVVSGVMRHPSDGFSGRGIQIESEFNTSIVVSNTTVSSTSLDEVKGLYILKNNAFGNAQTSSDINVALNGNTVNLGENSLAYQLEVFAGTADFPADTGTLTLSGSKNTTPNTQAVNLSLGSATLNGTIEINGLMYPQ